MHAAAVQRVMPAASATPAVAALSMYSCERDEPRIIIPRSEIQIVARFGPSAQGGLDVHAFGPRQVVHRKRIRAGQRSVTARLQLGASNAVLGIPATLMAERILPLEELWGRAAAQRLCARLAAARDPAAAVAILDTAIAERVATVREPSAHTQLALAAAQRLTTATATVGAVAAELGVSERQLRRVFWETVGMSPKAFTKLARFQRALREARNHANVKWASIAASAGYYDQAHLIADFRALAGTTPSALLGELAAGALLG